ncbi:MAG: diguanylate cyclase [Candidatus Moraniibacteriota bacterium]
MKKESSKIDIFTSAEYNKKILDNIPASVITIDKEGFITSANKYFLNFAKNKNYRKCNIFKDEFFEREQLIEGYKNLLKNGTVFRRDNCYEKNSKGQDKYLGIVAVPLKDKNGEIEGALSIAADNTEVVSFRKKLENLNKSLEIKILARTKELEKANEKLQRLSSYDILTSLHNRNYFERRLREFRKRKKFEGCVVMIDINGLKKINDTLGHIAGDKVIRQVAKFIAGEFRQEDVVMRIGGDEFCVLLPGMKFTEIDVIIKRLQQKIFDSQKRKKHDLRLSISIGAAHAATGNDLMTALKVADERMYKYKIAAKKKNS